MDETGGGGGALEPLFQTRPLQGSRDGDPRRANCGGWGGGGWGVLRHPNTCMRLRMIPRDALIISRDVSSGGWFFFQTKSFGPLLLRRL